MNYLPDVGGNAEAQEAMMRQLCDVKRQIETICDLLAESDYSLESKGWLRAEQNKLKHQRNDLAATLHREGISWKGIATISSVPEGLEKRIAKIRVRVD